MLVAFLIILASTYFVAAETALVSLRESRLKLLRELGHPRDRWLLKLTKNPADWLGVVQLGITLVNFIGGAAVIAVIAPLIAPWIEVMLPGYGLSVSYVLVTAALTYVMLIFGELIPKMLAIVYPESIARFSAPLLVFFIWITYPFIWVISVSTMFFSRPFTKGRVVQAEVTEQEIQHIILKHGTISHFEKKLAARIFKFGDTLAHEIMTPRPDVIALPDSATLEDLRRVAEESGYSRFPIYEGGIDSIVGIVVLKDALLDSDAGEDTPITRWLRREIPVVPEVVPILNIYQNLEWGRLHMAVVIDEHGGTAGVVTLEDIVEEVFGDIRDEHDQGGAPWHEEAGGVVVSKGLVSVKELNDELGLGLPEGEGYETVAGLVMERLGRIPGSGESVVTDGATITVLQMKGNRIVRVRIAPVIKEGQNKK